MKDKIELRKFKASDLNSIMKLFIDKKVIQGIGLDMEPEKITKKSERTWLEKTIKGYRKKKPGSYNLAILLDNNYIGSIGCNKIDYKNRNIEIGYWIGSDYWNNGYMTKALKLFLKEIRKKFNLTRIVACHFPKNPASGKVMEKWGFKYEGTRKKVHKKGNKFIDDKMYAITK